MTGVGRRLVFAACAVAAAASTATSSAHAQSILKRIKDQAARRVADGRAKVDSTVLRTTGTAVDSAVTKTNRGTDAVANRVGNVANGAIAATERGVTRLAGGSQSSPDYAARLAKGPLVLEELRFVGRSDQLDPSADTLLAQLAAALAGTTGTFLIEGHTDDGTPAAEAQSLSQQRASAVKARLTTAGVPADRLVAVGYGATRPNAANPQANARIEIVRAQ